jgi:hypothetical protein
MIGLAISERQVVRVLNEGKELFIKEARDVLRAAFQKAATWISVDDTGARHKGRNGFCTQIGNDTFTFFATTGSKSRLNFLGLLRAGHADYVLNGAAFDYMRKRNLPGFIIDKLAAHPCQRFVNENAWREHLERLDLTGLKVHPDPVMIATEGALWGAVAAYGFLNGAVILSDDAGQFNIGKDALCWVHYVELIFMWSSLPKQQYWLIISRRRTPHNFFSLQGSLPTTRKRNYCRSRYEQILASSSTLGTMNGVMPGCLAVPCTLWEAARLPATAATGE